MNLAALEDALRRRGVRSRFRRGARLDALPIALLAHAERIAIVAPPLAGDEARLAPLRAQGFDVLDATGDPEELAERAAWLMAHPPPVRDRLFIDRALSLAARNAADGGEVPVGAVLVRDGLVLAEAANETVAACDPTAHAELLVLRRAAQRIGDWRLCGASLYVTLEPCAMCAGAILQARVARLVWAADDPRAGAVVSRLRLPEQLSDLRRIELVGGVQAQAAADLLRSFFARRRRGTARDQKKR